MSLQLFWDCGCSGLQKIVVVMDCKGSSSDLVRHEPNSIEMRCDKTLKVLAVGDALLYCLDMVSISIHSAFGGTLDVLATVLGLRLF